MSTKQEEGKEKKKKMDQEKVLKETQERLQRLEASRRELLDAGGEISEPPGVSSFKERRASLKRALVTGWSDRKAESLRLAEKIELFRTAMQSVLGVAAVDPGSGDFGADCDAEYEVDGSGNPVGSAHRYPPGSTAAAIAAERGRHVAIRENVDQLGEVAARLEHALSTYEAATGEFIAPAAADAHDGRAGLDREYSGRLLKPGAAAGGGDGDAGGSENEDVEYVEMPSAEIPFEARGRGFTVGDPDDVTLGGGATLGSHQHIPGGPVSAVTALREATDDLLASINARENESLLHGLLNWFTSHAEAEEAKVWTVIGGRSGGDNTTTEGGERNRVPSHAQPQPSADSEAEPTIASIEEEDREIDESIAETLSRIDEVGRIRAREAEALRHRLAAIQRQSQLERASFGGRRGMLGPNGRRMMVPTAADHALNARRRGSIIAAMGTLGRDTHGLSAGGTGGDGGDGGGGVSDLPSEDDVIAALNAEIASLRRERDDLRWRRAQAALRHTDAISEHERLLHAEAAKVAGLQKKIDDLHLQVTDSFRRENAMRSLLSEADASLIPLSTTDETKELLRRIGRLVRESRKAAEMDDERERQEKERQMRLRAEGMPDQDDDDNDDETGEGSNNKTKGEKDSKKEKKKKTKNPGASGGAIASAISDALSDESEEEQEQEGAEDQGEEEGEGKGETDADKKDGIPVKPDLATFRAAPESVRRHVTELHAALSDTRGRLAAAERAAVSDRAKAISASRSLGKVLRLARDVLEENEFLLALLEAQGNVRLRGTARGMLYSYFERAGVIRAPCQERGVQCEINVPALLVRTGFGTGDDGIVTRESSAMFTNDEVPRESSIVLQLPQGESAPELGSGNGSQAAPSVASSTGRGGGSKRTHKTTRKKKTRSKAGGSVSAKQQSQTAQSSSHDKPNTNQNNKGSENAPGRSPSAIASETEHSGSRRRLMTAGSSLNGVSNSHQSTAGDIGGPNQANFGSNRSSRPAPVATTTTGVDLHVVHEVSDDAATSSGDEGGGGGGNNSNHFERRNGNGSSALNSGTTAAGLILPGVGPSVSTESVTLFASEITPRDRRAKDARRSAAPERSSADDLGAVTADALRSDSPALFDGDDPAGGDGASDGRSVTSRMVPFEGGPPLVVNMLAAVGEASETSSTSVFPGGAVVGPLEIATAGAAAGGGGTPGDGENDGENDGDDHRNINNSSSNNSSGNIQSGHGAYSMVAATTTADGGAVERGTLLLDGQPTPVLVERAHPADAACAGVAAHQAMGPLDVHTAPSSTVVLPSIERPVAESTPVGFQSRHSYVLESRGDPGTREHLMQLVTDTAAADMTAALAGTSSQAAANPLIDPSTSARAGAHPLLRRLNDKSAANRRALEVRVARLVAKGDIDPDSVGSAEANINDDEADTVADGGAPNDAAAQEDDAGLVRKPAMPPIISAARSPSEIERRHIQLEAAIEAAFKVSGVRGGDPDGGIALASVPQSATGSSRASHPMDSRGSGGLATGAGNGFGNGVGTGGALSPRASPPTTGRPMPMSPRKGRALGGAGSTLSPLAKAPSPLGNAAAAVEPIVGTAASAAKKTEP